MNSFKQDAVYTLMGLLRKGEIASVIGIGDNYNVLGAAYDRETIVKLLREPSLSGFYAENGSGSLLYSFDSNEVRKGLESSFKGTTVHHLYDMRELAVKDAIFYGGDLNESLVGNKKRLLNLYNYFNRLDSQRFVAGYSSDVYDHVNLLINGLKIMITSESILVLTSLGSPLIVHSPDRDVELEFLRDFFIGLGLVNPNTLLNILTS